MKELKIYSNKKVSFNICGFFDKLNKISLHRLAWVSNNKISDFKLSLIIFSFFKSPKTKEIVFKGVLN